MPPGSTVTEHQILNYSEVAANSLQDVAKASEIPFVASVCNLTLGIIPMIRNTKFLKERCLQIADDVHHLLCVLMALSIADEDIQSPRMLERIAECTMTLQKIESCLRAQQDLGRIKRLFKQSELAAQLESSGTELKEVLNFWHAAAAIARWAAVFMAFTLLPTVRDMWALYQSLRCFGDVLAAQGMDDSALNILTVALEGFTWMDVHHWRAQCMQSIGDLHLRRGEFSKAATFWKEARPLFEVLSQVKSVERIDRRLFELKQHHTNLDYLLSLNVPDLPMRQLSIATEASPQAEESS
ncbi:hypothetical protein K438DRAFT_1758701 [Mycena galopus ATCC 62051]|nr:hypothetical protein K438DRAFT_1758701 [Mycena galopus ATCC 62051]